MKNIYLILSLGISLFFAACNNTGSTSSTSSSEENESTTTKKITKRNYAITANNSYSSFFFDSSELVKYITDNKVPDSISRRLISFYNNRNYQYAWFGTTGPTEQARGFWNMYEYYLTSDKEKVIIDDVMKKAMDQFVASDDSSWSGKEKNLLSTELKLSESFIRFFTSNVEKGYIKRKEMEKFIPFVKTDAIQLADSLINKKHKDDKYYEDVNISYAGLKNYLNKYLQVQKAGGWPVVNASAKQLKEKTASPLVSVLKKRLYLSGDLVTADTTNN